MAVYLCVCAKRPFWKLNSPLWGKTDWQELSAVWDALMQTHKHAQATGHSGSLHHLFVLNSLCILLLLFLLQPLLTYFFVFLSVPTFFSSPLFFFSLTLIVWLTGSLVWAWELNLQAQFKLWPDHLPSDIRGLEAWPELGMRSPKQSQGYTQRRTWTETCTHMHVQQNPFSCTHIPVSDSQLFCSWQTENKSLSFYLSSNFLLLLPTPIQPISPSILSSWFLPCYTCVHTHTNTSDHPSVLSGRESGEGKSSAFWELAFYIFLKAWVGPWSA